MEIRRGILTKIRKYFSQKPGVAAVYLFGSFARKEAGQDSDLDLGILLTQKTEKPFSLPQVTFAKELEPVVERKVEIQDLEACRVDFAHRVISEGKLIYSGDEKKRIDFEEKILRNYFNLKPALDEYYRHLSEIVYRGELNARYI